MEITTQMIDALKASKTPEQAYKEFATMMAEGLGKLMSESLAKAINTAVSQSKSNSSIDGWQEYFKNGIMLNAAIGPGYKIPPTYVTTFAQSIEAISIKGGSVNVSVGASWNF